MRYEGGAAAAGSAGGTVASRLSEDPQRSVLLLEAGPDYPDFERLPDDFDAWASWGNDEWTFERDDPRNSAPRPGETAS